MSTVMEQALQRIADLEAANAHLLKVIKGRKLAGAAGKTVNGSIQFFPEPSAEFEVFHHLYFISDEYDAAGFLITPEVKIEN